MDLLEKYIHDYTTTENSLMRELDRVTHQRVVNPQMLSGHIQGKLLEMITRMIDPHNVLEIGTYTGYSALSIAAGMSGGTMLHTIEVDDEQEEMILSFFDRSEYKDRLRLHIGSALEIVHTLGKTFDMVFIDGDKREYPAYYRMLMGDGEYSANGAMVHSGSWLIADNILWYGKVAEPDVYTDLHTKAIVEFNRVIAADPRVENVIIPLRDGLNLIRVK